MSNNDKTTDSAAGADSLDRIVGHYSREYLGCPVPETPERNQLRILATEYVERTEAYDRFVCTGPITRSGIMPATPWERTTINQNAKKVMAELMEKVRRLGFSEMEFKREISLLPNVEDHGHLPATKGAK